MIQFGRVRVLALGHFSRNRIMTFKTSFSKEEKEKEETQ